MEGRRRRRPLERFARRTSRRRARPARPALLVPPPRRLLAGCRRSHRRTGARTSSSISRRRSTCALSVARPVFDATVNIIGSLNICEAAVAAEVNKVVFAGSGGTLYGSPSEIPTREGAPQHPESPYGVAKKAVGDYLHYYRQVRGLEYTVLALANVYGPRQDPHGEAGRRRDLRGPAARARAADDLRRRIADARLRLRRRQSSTRSHVPSTRAAVSCSTSAPGSRRVCSSSTT